MSVAVLHVDDNKDFLYLISFLLQRQTRELEIDSVSCPKLALNQMRHREYDLIISDFQMPGMTGLQFLSTIRRQGFTTPFVLLSGSGKFLQEKLTNTYDYFIEKQCDIENQTQQLSHIVQ